MKINKNKRPAARETSEPVKRVSSGALARLSGWRAWLEVWRMRVCRMEIRAPRPSDPGMKTLSLQQRAGSCPFGCCAEGSDTNCPIFQGTELNRTGWVWSGEEADADPAMAAASKGTAPGSLDCESRSSSSRCNACNPCSNIHIL